MSQPVIADNKPRKVTLTQGETYFWCVCGRSKDQPFCDGSHKGTGFKPKRCVAEESGDVFLCQCKQTGDAPFCDGTHKRFGKEQVGKEAPEATGQDANQTPQTRNTDGEPRVEFIHQLAR